MVRTITVGSRGSHLARAMTKELLGPLERALPEVSFRQRVVMTSGDRNRTTQLNALSNSTRGAFTTQLEQALQAGEIDIAVHSLKDLPTASHDGLVLAAVPPRADLRDALCGTRLDDLPTGGRVGTGSPRRIAQIKALRPDIQDVPIRGNVPPRLQKLKESSRLDGVILAAAGLLRLGFGDQISEFLSPEEFPPSPGQGALGIQVRADDTDLREMLVAVNDPAAAAAVKAERTLLAELQGGCSVPIGAFAVVEHHSVRLMGQVTTLDGSWHLRMEAAGRTEAADQVGRQLANDLLAKGADRILADVRAEDGNARSPSRS